MLKPGGELYFSDIFSASRVPTELKEDQEVTVNGFDGNVYEGKIEVEVEEKLSEYVPLTQKEAKEIKEIVKETSETGVQEPETLSIDEEEKRIKEKFIKKIWFYAFKNRKL